MSHNKSNTAMVKNSHNPRLNTYTILMLRYMSPVVALEIVVEDYLNHMSLEIAKRKAIKQELPFPVARLGDNQKAPWVVNLADLALYIDKQIELAKQDYTAMNGSM